MELLIHLVGFAGGWLLVAGPLFQAVIELREQELDREGFEKSFATVSPPPRMSPWWWLLPPVAYLKSARRRRVSRDASFAALTVPQREQLMGFMNKAHGWFTVAIGALFIAAKETWELVELLHLPTWLFWVVIVVLGIAVLVNTSVQLARSDARVHVDDPGYHDRLRAERQAERRSQSESRRKQR